MIDEIERAVVAANWRAAIELALGAWRTRRAPELAELVEALAPRLGSAPFVKTRKAVFHELWFIALAADPVANLGPALATLTQLLPLGKTGPSPLGSSLLRRKYAPWLARVAALRAIDDPRVATALVDVMARTPFVDTFSGEETVYDPVLDVLERLGDVRQVTPLRTIAASPTAPRTWLRELQATELRWLAESLEEQEIVALDADERERVVRLLAGIGEPIRAEPRGDDELLALVHDAPDDDTPRAILADLWLERGDPRGELVTLQLKDARGEASEHDRKRAAAIVRRHEKDWLGALAAVTMKRRYVRGFLDHLELRANSAASEETWTAALAAPALGTVRFVDGGRSNATHYEQFILAGPNLRSAGARKSFFDVLVARPPPRLTHLAIGFGLTPKIVDVIAGSFPTLEELTIRITPRSLEAQIGLAKVLVARRSTLRVSATGSAQDLASRWEHALAAESASVRRARSR